MNNLKILLKNNFNIFLGSLNKKNKKNRIGAVGLVVGAIIVFGIWFMQAYFMSKDFSSYGLSKMCLFNGINIALTVLVIMGVMRTVGKSKTNDSDLLLSLPLKKSQIVLSKFVNLYLIDFSLLFIILVPFIIVYQIFTTFSLYLTLMSVVLLLFLPLLSISLTHIIGFFVTRFINAKRNSDFLKTMFSSLFMAIIIGMMIYKNVTMSGVSTNPSEMETYFQDRLLTNCILKLLVEKQVLNLLIVLAVCLIPFVLGVWLYSLNFGNDFNKSKAKSGVLKFKEKTSPFSGFLTKELKRYFTSPTFFSNTFISPLFMILIPIVLLCVGTDSISAFVGAIPVQISLLVALVYCFLISTAYISCCTISLEGKQLWILKSSPIDERKMLLSKAFLQIIIILPVLTLSQIALAIIIGMPLLDALICWLISAMYCIAMSFGGLFINLLLPKFDWDDEVKVVKQGMSVLITMIIGMILVMIPTLLVFAISGISEIILWATLGLFTLLSVIFVCLTLTKGVKLFRKL